MKFSVPYVYLGIPSKNLLNSGAEVFGDWEPIEVPVRSADDAPVAARSVISRHDGSSSVTELRMFEGDCYRLKREVPVGDYYRSDMPPLHLDDLGMRSPFVASCAGASKEYYVADDSPPNGLPTDTIDYVLEAAGRQREPTDLLRSNQHTVRRQIQEAAGSLFVLENEIWEKCNAPVLSMLIGRDAPHFDLHFIDIPKDPNCLEIVVPLTGLNQLRMAALSFCEEPMAWGVSNRKANWSVNFDEIIFPTVEVYDPRALTLPMAILDRNINDQLYHIPHPGSKNLDYMDDEYIDAWQLLRRLKNASKNDLDDNTSGELVEALNNLAQLRIDRLNGQDSSFAYVYRLATEKLEIWALKAHICILNENEMKDIGMSTPRSGHPL